LFLSSVGSAFCIGGFLSMGSETTVSNSEAGQQSLPRHFVIVGDGVTVRYEFEVTGSVEKTDSAGPAPIDAAVTINDFDTISGNQVSGRTTSEADAYRYSGEIQNFEADNDFIAYRDGNLFDPDGSSLPNHFLIIGDGETACYEFEVTGEVEKTGSAGPAPIDAPVTINDFDTISGNQVSGRTTNEADAYRYSGELQNLDVTGEFIAYIDGEGVRSDDGGSSPMLENHLVIVGNGETARYEFEVTGDAEKTDSAGSAPIDTPVTINDFDTISGNQVSGRTTSEADAYRFSGLMTEFSVDGEFIAYLNGNRQREIGDATIPQINELQFECSGAFVDILYPEETLTAVFADGSRKHYFDNSVNDGRIGSPGRRLARIELDNQIAVNPNQNCRPTSSPATTFDCTSVTIREGELEELEFGGEIVAAQLVFTDGTVEEFNAPDPTGELPVPLTLSGTGTNRGKPIERAEIRDNYGNQFVFVNPDAETC